MSAATCPGLADIAITAAYRQPVAPRTSRTLTNVEADAERSVRMIRARPGSWETALLTGESRLGAGAGELAQRELDHGQQRLRRVGAKPALQKFLARGSPGTV